MLVKQILIESLYKKNRLKLPIQMFAITEIYSAKFQSTNPLTKQQAVKS